MTPLEFMEKLYEF